MKGRIMGMRHNNSRGFTLIAALMLTILLSGVAVGLLYMVSNEARMGGNDLEGNLAYYGAEAGIENLTSELSQLYQSSQSPNAASLQALVNASNYPTAVSGANITNMNYVETINWPATRTDGTACPNAPDPCGSWDIVGSGPDQGMVATLIPFTLQVTASRQAGAGQSSYSTAAATGASVNLTRTVEVALLPAFEFGIFCDGDCDYFAGPDFNFGGRVHTNGNLFVASGSKLTFTDKIAAVGQVIMDQLENGHATAAGYTGTPYVPNAGGGCPAAPGTGPAANCLALPAGSWTGGFPPTGTANPAWTGISKATFMGFIENGLTGAKKLQLPFVQNSTVGAMDIIRRPQAGDTTLLSNSRLYNEAEIRVLLADNINDLHPERSLGVLDADDIQLGPAVENGVPVLNATANMYYGEVQKSTGSWITTAPASSAGALCLASDTQWPLAGQVTQGTPCTGSWLRVEYLDNANTWHGITREWLGYGFGRGYNYPPTAPSGVAAACPLAGNPAGPCSNPISPAILILQQLRSGMTVAQASGAGTAYNWLPINFYDAREGEARDLRSGGNPASCSPSGVMNVVEVDAGNLWLWLQGKAPYTAGSGKNVNSANMNGYILYFYDHRGMRPDPNPTGNGLYNRYTGMSGLEDTVNAGSSTGIPDGVLEPKVYYKFSPEDVNADNYLDTWGQALLGSGFGLTGAAVAQPYYIPGTTAGIASCSTTAQWNIVTGPRHALRLVDGGMDGTGHSYLPQPIAPATSGNGFTVASEEPVYVYGDYNSGSADPFFTSGGTNITTPHSAAAIIADSVTLLSNAPISAGGFANVGWTDLESFSFPAAAGSRNGNTSYYRMAIAAGKSVPFPQPAWGGQDFGTDGGMHNFLRYLENRGYNGATVNYAGSLVSMYYSQYNTGVFKCCTSVYSPPTRNYFFDTMFLNPANLPPGTPMFQDVVSLSYHQNFTPQ
jgi:type IV pilus assembly PilX-like protein